MSELVQDVGVRATPSGKKVGTFAPQRLAVFVGRDTQRQVADPHGYANGKTVRRVPAGA